MPLTPESLADLPPAVTGCLSWELDAVRRAREEAAGEAASAKREWVARVRREWGTAGHVVYVQDRAVACSVHAPAAYLPGAASLPTAPVGDDALLLATAWVDPVLRRRGLGRLLVQVLMRDVVRGGEVRAVEAFGAVGPATGCVLPADFLIATGFGPQRPHPRHPRLRLDAATTVTWRGEVEAALERLRGLARPAPTPARQARVGRARVGLSR